MPVDSRRHCTESPSTKLGGQQWRRRERKQRRRNRRRSVGRRSSLRRNRSSTFSKSKIASHGPARVEGNPPETGRPSDRQRASAGRRFKLHHRAVRDGEEDGKSNLPLAQMPVALILKTSRRSPPFVGGVLSELQRRHGAIHGAVFRLSLRGAQRRSKLGGARKGWIASLRSQ